MGTLKSFDDIKHSYYINLEHRTDRKEHVESQLSNLGIKAKRFNAIKMDNGAIGCSMSHLNVLQNALNQKLDHILIVEDDITFLDSGLFKTQINKFFEKHNNNWDVILLAGQRPVPSRPYHLLAWFVVVVRRPRQRTYTSRRLSLGELSLLCERPCVAHCYPCSLPCVRHVCIVPFLPRMFSMHFSVPYDILPWHCSTCFDCFLRLCILQRPYHDYDYD